jgi:hypothetical protein
MSANPNNTPWQKAQWEKTKATKRRGLGYSPTQIIKFKPKKRGSFAVRTLQSLQGVPTS